MRSIGHSGASDTPLDARGGTARADRARSMGTEISRSGRRTPSPGLRNRVRAGGGGMAFKGARTEVAQFMPGLRWALWPGCTRATQTQRKAWPGSAANAAPWPVVTLTTLVAAAGDKTAAED